MSDGHLISAANVENAAFGSTICAERAAVMRANAMERRNFDGIAIIGGGPDFKTEPGSKPTGPCGACRQVLYEMSEVGKNDPWVVFCSPDEKEFVVTTVGDLLPHGFGPSNIGKDVSPWATP